MKVYSLELLMQSRRADQLRYHFYTDLKKLSVAPPDRIGKILRIGPKEASKLIDRAKMKVKEIDERED